MDPTALFDEWFRIADKDRDGKIGGTEAVEFFQRSGLDKGTLFQVWNLVAGNSQALNKPQFYSAMRLVSLAQQSGGMLPEAQARMLLIGTGAVPPPPRMSGLEAPVKEAVKQWAPQPPAPIAPVPSFAGGGTPPGTPGSQFPPMAAADMQRYQATFAQLDRDRDGLVQGGECYTYFLQWGLPKQTLKDVWDVVAGNQGHLSAQQFVSCLYIMDNAKRGMMVPRTLPPGPFPPMAGGPNPVSLDASGKMSFSMPQYQAQVDVTGQQINIAPLPAKATYTDAPGGAEYTSRTPVFDESRMNELAPGERSRLTNEREAGELKDQELFNVQQEAARATAKAKFYREALGELALFKSKTDVALLQAQERLSMDNSEAESLEKRYSDAYAGAQAQFEESMRLRDSVAGAREKRLAAAARLAALEADIAGLAGMSAETVEREEEEAAVLEKRVAEAEARKAALEGQTDGLKEQKAALEAGLEALQGLVKKMEADVSECQHELNTFQAQVKSGSIGDGAVASLALMMKNTASVYRTLRDYANNLQAPIPPEAVVGPWHPDSDLEFSKLQLAAADNYWDDFKDEGFRTVSALPADMRVSSVASGITGGAAPPTDTPSAAADVAAPAAAPMDAAPAEAVAGGADANWMKF